jgi:hypothetical protein
MKPNRRTNFTNLLWHETLRVSDSSSVHQQEFIHSTLSDGVCHTALKQGQVGSILVLLESCLQTCMKQTIADFTVNKLMMIDELSETCRVSCQNKFVKLVHLFGFIIVHAPQLK